MEYFNTIIQSLLLCSIIYLIYSNKNILINIRRISKHNNNQDENEVEKFWKEYESTNDQFWKEICIQVIFAKTTEQSKVFNYLLIETDKKIKKWLEIRDYQIILKTIRNLASILQRITSTSSIEEVKAMYIEYNKIANKILKKCQNSVQTQYKNLDYKDLILIPPEYIPVEIKKEFIEFLNKQQILTETKELQNLLDSIYSINPTDKFAIYKLQEINVKLINISNRSILKSEDHYTIREELEKAFHKATSFNTSTYQIPTEQDLLLLHEILSMWKIPHIANKKDYEDCEKQIPRITEIINHNYEIESQFKTVYGSEKAKSTTILLNDWATFLNNFERSKILAYEKCSLDKIMSAKKDFTETSYFLESDSEKLKLSLEILKKHIWPIEETLLSSGAFKLMREIEEEILSKVNVAGKVELFKNRLNTKKLTLIELLNEN